MLKDAVLGRERFQGLKLTDLLTRNLSAALTQIFYEHTGGKYLSQLGRFRAYILIRHYQDGYHSEPPVKS